MIIVSVSENIDSEKRISITPEISKKYINLGFEVHLSENYGVHLGFKDDERNYENISEMIKFLAIKKIDLMTNNPKKIDALEAILNSLFFCLPCLDKNFPITLSDNPIP